MYWASFQGSKSPAKEEKGKRLLLIMKVTPIIEGADLPTVTTGVGGDSNER